MDRGRVKFRYNSWELTALPMEGAACFCCSFPALLLFLFQMLLSVEAGAAGPAGPRAQEGRGREGDSATTLPHRMVAPPAQGQTLRQFLARRNHTKLMARLLGKASPHWLSELASLCPWVSPKSEISGGTGSWEGVRNHTSGCALSCGIECAS